MTRAKVTDTQLREWEYTGHPYKLIAAAIAEWAAGRERGTALPDNEFFGIEASPSTYKNAGIYSHDTCHGGLLRVATVNRLRQLVSLWAWQHITAGPWSRFTT